MADDPDPYASPYQSPYAAPVMPLTIQNPELAKAFVDEHKAGVEAYKKQLADTEQAQQMNIDKMSKVLDDTAASIRQRKSGESNLPLMAMGAAMMSSPGGIGQQIGAGFKAMVPAIQQQREEDQATDLKLAGLEMQKGQLQNMPLAERMKYIQALMKGDVDSIKAVELAQLRGQPTAKQQADVDLKQQEEARKVAADKQKQDLAQQKIKADIIRNASKSALDAYKEATKSSFYSKTAAQDLYRQMLENHIKLASQGTGVQLNDDDIKQALDLMKPQLGTPGGTDSLGGDQVDASGGPKNVPTGAPTKVEGVDEDYLKTLDPAYAAYIKAVARGEKQFPGDRGKLTGQQIQLMEDVKKYDPSFSTLDYNMRSGTIKDFTSGQAARNVTSLNTATQHMAKLHDLAQKMQNSGSPDWNSFVNYARVHGMLGQDQSALPTNFKAAAHPVAEEISKVFKGSNLSDSEIKAWESSLNENMTPAQIQGAMDTLQELLRGRINALEDQYKRGMGKFAQPFSALDDESKKRIEYMQNNPIYGKPPAHEGTPSTAPDKTAKKPWERTW